MSEVISHLRARLDEAVVALGEGGPGEGGAGEDLPDLTLGLVIGGRLHVVWGTDPPAASRQLIEAAAAGPSCVDDGTTVVVPLVVDDVLRGLLVAPVDGGREGVWSAPTLRLLAHHLAGELVHARTHARVEGLLRTYTSAGIADSLMTTGPPAGGRRDVTLLFADLRGFTSFTERTASEVVVSHLNAVLAPAIGIIEAHGGTVANLMGDGIMATFGAPRPQQDHPLRAAQAGLALARAAHADHPDLPRFGVGVNTGSVFVGDIGGRHRKVFTMIGDAVNLAARLESTTRPGQVVIGEETYRTLRSIAEVEVLDPVVLKGKADPVQAYRLLALADPDRVAGVAGA